MTIRPRPPFSRLRDHEVFSVGATDAQITWRGLAGPAELVIDGRVFGLDDPAGAIVVDGLAPDTPHVAVIRSGGSTVAELPFRTRPDIGPISAKFATISDVHLGLRGFGVGKVIKDPSDPPFPVRAARAAIREATEWGAEVLLIKGDLTESGWLAEWELAKTLVGEATIPVLVTGGNHDGFSRAQIEPVNGMAMAGLGYAPIQIHDLDGVRIVLAETSIRHKGTGTLRPIADELLAAVDGTDDPVFIGMHHNIQHVPIPWFWPPGISSTDAAPVLARLADTGSSLFLSSGHTHRNRAHRVGPGRALRFTEVASTSDYPGVWAGYEVSATTVRQTVRRIADPVAIRWSERARHAVVRIWPRWSQGRLDDRCVDVSIR